MSNEYISRESVLADIEQTIENSGCANNEREIIDCVRYADAADVAPVHRGEWVEFDGEGTYQCTYCGEPFILIEGTPSDNEYNYCPKCGAYLREGLAGGEHHAE